MSHMEFDNLYNFSENGIQLVLWVGQQVSHDFISQVFGAPSPAQIDTDMVRYWLPPLYMY